MVRVLFREALLRRSQLLRALSSTPASTSPFVRRFQTGEGKGGSFESTDDFERRLFGDLDGGGNNDPFFRKLDRAEKSFLRSNVGQQQLSADADSDYEDDLDVTFDSMDDGMDEELQQHCRKFFKHTDEILDEDYAFRPDVQFKEGDTYTLTDLDLTKPAPRRPPQRHEFQTTTEEVLRKADFRNVRFLSNFITEAGIIIKRSQTRISAKAQRKVAREIKTARVLGLMPFTSMGTKTFVFGKNMKDQDEEYEYSTYDDHTGFDDAVPDAKPIRG
ncbi:30S ribosomal protein S18 [Rhynchospora pubera]|uniref:Small ribosomal subunit protein bS18c n=1 Tax=Rhynchospora pubera TaxID=906938 RepID=A0AAV8C3V5_9POAL|nr:30S ribosomal protein S18 [Rhynchospora pubera]